MRYLILFLALVFAPPAYADSTPQTQIKALMDYCVPAIEQGIAPADYAVERKLSEFPPDQALKFSPEGGRVFAIPTDLGNAVLMTNKDYDGMCGIAVRQTDADVFWKLIHQTFNKETGYRLKREKRMESERVSRKDFEKETLQGPIALLVSASDRSREGGMQALMTLARVKSKTSP